MRHRGAMLFELLVATVVLGTALTISAKLAGFSHAQYRSDAHRALALDEAANLMERIAALPADEITAERVAEFQLSESVTKALRDARLTIDVHDEPGDLPTRRVSLAIRWRNRGGQDDAPVRLTTWMFSTSTEEVSP